MPVKTRAQAKLASQGPASAQQSLPDDSATSSLKGIARQGSSNEPFTPRSLNAAGAVRPCTASKAPFSHPLVEETAAMSLEDRSTPRGASGFTIAAVPAPPAAPAAPRLPPEEKLLKPLPDQPVECTKLPDGPEPVVIEIEYPATEELTPIEGDTAAALAEALAGAQATEWAAACAALVTLRRLAVHHPAVAGPALPEAMPLVVKAARSLRSALCKTAIMTLRDFYLACPAAMLPLTDVGGPAVPVNSALAQLLLKVASNDKKFVIEEAQRALVTATDVLPSVDFLELLKPYVLDHKNMKVRGKAAAVVAVCVGRLSAAEAHAYGLESLLTAAARLITDNTPDARDAAKKVAAAVKAAFEDPTVAAAMDVQVSPPAPVAEGEEEPKVLTPWEYWCQATLGVAKAQSVLRAV
jgi:hypothetical protein